MNARNGKDMKRPLSPPPKRHEASDYDGPDWSVAEDHSLLYVCFMKKIFGLEALRYVCE